MRCVFISLSHPHNLISEEVDQTLRVYQKCSAVKFLLQSLTEEHHILHQQAHLTIRRLTLAV